MPCRYLIKLYPGREANLTKIFLIRYSEALHQPREAEQDNHTRITARVLGGRRQG